MKELAENRFLDARKYLSIALAELEKITKEKIHDAAIQSKLIDISDDNDELQSKIIAQSAIIESLNFEINNLQKSLADLGKEAEFLAEKNKSLGKRINNLSQSGLSLIAAIESDFVKIETIINKEE